MQVINTEEGAVVTFDDGDFVAMFCCAHMAEALHRRLMIIRDMPYRNAMKSLTTELGCCDLIAEGLYKKLSDEPRGRLQ